MAPAQLLRKGVISPRPRAVPSIWRLTLKRIDPLVVLNHGWIDHHIYCIHPITGDVDGLKDFADAFGPRRVHAIQVPKEQMTGAFATSIDAIARRYVMLITDRQPEGPINLVGWSAGAVVALEMARQLRELGRDVPLLAALDGAPCNTGAGLKRWDPRYLLRLAVNVPRWIRNDRNQDWSWRGILKRLEGKLAFRFGIGATRLADHQTMDVETIRSLGDRTWQSGQKAFIHAFYKAIIDYVPGPYPGKVLVYETRTQPLIHLRQIGAAWRVIAARTEIVPVEGNHSGMIHKPAIGMIARHLVSRLDDVSPQ